VPISPASPCPGCPVQPACGAARCRPWARPSPATKATRSCVHPSAPGTNPFPLAEHLESNRGQTPAPPSIGYLQHQPDLAPSSPAHLTSAPWWGARGAEEGAPFPPPGKAMALAAICSRFPSDMGRVFAWPQRTQPPPASPGAGAGSGIEILFGRDRHTESPSLPTHTKQPSAKKNNRHEKVLRH